VKRVVFGLGPVRELLRSQRAGISVLWVSKARVRRGADPLADLVAEAERLGIAVEPREPTELDEAAGPGAVHQGVVAIAGAFRYVDLEEIAARAVAAGPHGLVVALDGVTDPHNLGAIARSAYLFGAHGIILPRDRAAEVTPVAVKASAGATEHLPIAQVTNLARALGELKEAGLWNAALAAGPEATPLWKLDAASTPLCLVLGAEGSGIRPLVARQCDFTVAIPMEGRAVGSLNVSVAAGVALYEIARQRGAAR
jgi:23S rRNA (guanosine2251-2'-O)-methyltransferase